MDLSLKLPYQGQSSLIALGLDYAAWVSCETEAVKDTFHRRKLRINFAAVR